uniref:Uncharacterized protein n=1 Tax=Aegilops tauschii subsp. strangulata TaxID=200361 RepID=A0A453CDI1_AEGTS
YTLFTFVFSPSSFHMRASNVHTSEFISALNACGFPSFGAV